MSRDVSRPAPRLARGRLALLALPILLFVSLQVRTLHYPFVWTDAAEYAQGSVLRPTDRLLEAFTEPLQRADRLETQVLAQPYYRPLQVVLASGVTAAFGREPTPLRAVSVALGALALAIFTGLAFELLRSAGAAALAGAVVAAHPVGLETHLWVSGLSAALASVFVLACVWLALRALRAPSAAGRAAFAAASLASLAAALLSKENGAIAAALVAALAACELRRPAGERRPVARTAAVLVALQVALVGAYLLVWRPRVIGSALNGAPLLGGRLETQLASSLAFWPGAMGWLLVPVHSSTSDAVWLVESLGSPAALAGAALALGSAALFGLWLARGRGVAAFALAWIWLAFAPTSGIVPLLHARAERNLFFSVYGVALLLAWGAAALRRRSIPAPALAAVGTLCVLGLAERTLARQPDWRSTETLFETDVARDPRHREGRVNLVVDYLQAGRAQDAKRQADALLAQRHPRGWSSYALDRNILELYCRANEAAGAEDDTLALYDAEFAGTHLSVWNDLGFLRCAARSLERAGRVRDVIPIYTELARMGSPEHRAGVDVALARCHAKLGELREARAWLAGVTPELQRRAGLGRDVARVRRLIRREASARRPEGRILGP